MTKKEDREVYVFIPFVYTSRTMGNPPDDQERGQGGLREDHPQGTGGVHHLPHRRVRQ